MKKSQKVKDNIHYMDHSSVLRMSTEEAINHVDMQDTMKSQFSSQEVDYFEFICNLKMIEIRQLDRIYFQTSAQPYYLNIKNQFQETSTQRKFQQNYSNDNQQKHENKSNGRVLKFTEENYEHSSFTSTEHNKVHPCQNARYDVVFGDCLGTHLYLVYKKSESHIVDEIHNLVIDKLKTNSLVPCFPEPKNKIVINICNYWYRAIVTSWPSETPETVLIKLVDLGRYVDVDKKQDYCYKVPDNINYEPLSFKMRVDKNVNVGCIASVEQLNTKSPVEANILNELGIEDNGIPVEIKPTKNKIENKVVLTLNTPHDVLMLSKEKDYHWVQHKNFVYKYEEWYDILESNTAEFTQTPHCGQYCLKKYEYVWCRAIVKSENPLKIFYVDYGNEELILNVEDLKPMPEICLLHEPFAFKIKWVEKSNSCMKYNYEEELTIIPVEALAGNVYQVLKPEEYSTRKDWSFKNESINISGGNLEMKKVQEVHVLDKTNEFLVALTPSPTSKANLYNNISLISNLDDSHDIKYEDINEGDYVLVFDSHSTLWYRAQLINQKDSIFYLIDVGRDCNSPKQLKSLLNNMYELPPRVVKIKINQSLLKLCDVKSVVEIIPDYLFDKNTVVSQLLLSSKFALESPLPLTLNREITALFSMTDAVDEKIAYFVTPIDTFVSTIKEIHTSIEKSKKLTEVNVGDYCGILDDNKFCRAKVLKVSNNKVTAFMIDVGYVDIVNTSECRELPDQIYAYPPCIIKTIPLDSVLHVDTQTKVTIVPRKEIARRVYSVNVRAKPN